MGRSNRRCERSWRRERRRSTAAHSASRCTSTEAREAGIEQFKLDALAAWHDVTSFDACAERAALALTEAMTRLADHGGVDDGVWESAREQFDDADLTTLLQVIALINAFNRINVTTERSAEDYVEYKQRRAKPAT